MKDPKRILIAREFVFGGIRVVILRISCMWLLLRLYTMNGNIQYQMFQPTRIILRSKLVMLDFVQSYKETMFSITKKTIPENIYLSKVNIRNTRKRHEIC